MDFSKKQKIGLIIIIAIILFITSIFYFNRNQDNNTEVISKNNKKSEEINKNNSSIQVYICGEIKKPGVYTLKTGDRLERLIELAGGTNVAADTSTLNLAQKLKDEDYIKVPKVLDSQSNGGAVSPAKTSDGKVNINTASKEQLEELPRIGESYAKRIIDYREKNGFFKDAEELKKVSGIGDKMFESIKDKICVR